MKGGWMTRQERSAAARFFLVAGSSCGPEFGGRAKDGLREETAIDQGLAAFVEIEEVGGGGVGGAAHGVAGERAVALLDVALGTGVEIGVEPGGDAGEEAAEGFEVGVFAAVGDVAGDGFDGHIALEGSGGETAQDGSGEAVEDVEPVLAGGGRLGSGLARRRRIPGRRIGRKCACLSRRQVYRGVR